MTIFYNAELNRLNDAKLAGDVAQATHYLAKSFAAEGKFPNYFFEREIYRWGLPQTLPNGEQYQEISYYSDGFGASLFISGDEMLLLGSNHELILSEDAIKGDRDLYLSTLVRGLPSRWDFVVNMLQTEARFELNPPISIFWFHDGNWHITDEYENIEKSEYGTRLGDHRGSVDYIPSGELAAVFAHAGRDSVDNDLIVEAQLKEWMTDFE